MDESLESSDIDFIKILYELELKELKEHKREEGVYWVTDLVRCPLKRIYEFKYPELVASQVFTPVFILGELVHKGLENLLQEYFGEGKVSIEVEGRKKVSLPSGKEVFIEGRADAILVLENGDKIGIEIKSSRSDIGLPLEHHVEQVKAYNWLFSLKKGVLLYVTPERIAQYPITDRFTDEDIIERIMDTTAPRYPWECSYCPFSVLCPMKLKGK